MLVRLIMFTGFMLPAVNALAYVGPGLGLGAIGAIFGVIVTILLAILGVVWYPLKRLFKGKKSEDAGMDGEDLS